MGKQKPITPYQRLLDSIREWCLKATRRHTVEMWFYPQDKLDAGWNLSELAQRVRAAAQLGYDVQLVWVDDLGLRVMYKKRLPEVPWEWR